MLQDKKNNVWMILLVFFSCADYELLNLGDPESVHLRINSISDSSVTLIWSRSVDEDFKSYKLYYAGKENAQTNGSLQTAISSVSDTSLTVNGLKQNTRYYFMVLVTTGRNLSSPSNEVDTVTLTEMITDTIRHLKLYAPEAISDSTVLLRWSRYTGFFDSYKIFGDTTWEVTIKDSLFATVYQDTTNVLKFDKSKKFWFKVFVKKDTSYLAHSNSIELTLP